MKQKKKISEEKQGRVKQANKLIETIASCGEKFFSYSRGFRISKFELSKTGHIWFIDAYSNKKIYTHDKYGPWRGFTNGGTLRTLVEHLRDYIAKGEKLPYHVFGPWPQWVCEGDLWGYGTEMQIVRDKAAELNIIEPWPNKKQEDYTCC